MLSLYRKFAMDAASIKRPRKMHFAGCKLYPNLRGKKSRNDIALLYQQKSLQRS